MKKISRFFTFVLVIMMSLSLVGCDFIGDLIGGLISGSNEETFEEDLKSKEQVISALGDNYEITLKFGYKSSEDESGAMYLTTKRVGDYLYSVNRGDEQSIEYLVAGNKAYTDLDPELNKFTRCINTANPEYIYSNVVEQIMASQSDSISYNTKKTSKFLERDVTIYKWKQSFGIGPLSFYNEFEYVVDNETGLFLKLGLQMGGNLAGQSENISTCFQVTSFKLKGVTFEKELDKVVISDWPSNSDFTTFGIAPIAKLNDHFVSSYASFSEGVVDELSYIYVIESSNTFDSLVESLYQKGFNRNSDNEVKTQAELVEEIEYAGAKSFEAYLETNEEYPYIQVTVVMEADFSENGSYQLVFKLANNK